MTPEARWRGGSLMELMGCLALLAVLTAMAIPLWQSWVSDNHLALTRDALMNDVQTARMQALQLGTDLQLSRANTCPWGSADLSDWSCGWQLLREDTRAVLRSHSIHAPLLLRMANASSLRIGARGELGQVGARWQISAGAAPEAKSYVVCVSSAGRLRWRSGRACS